MESDEHYLRLHRHHLPVVVRLRWHSLVLETPNKDRRIFFSMPTMPTTRIHFYSTLFGSLEIVKMLRIEFSALLRVESKRLNRSFCPFSLARFGWMPILSPPLLLCSSPCSSRLHLYPYRHLSEYLLSRVSRNTARTSSSASLITPLLRVFPTRSHRETVQRLSFSQSSF